MGCRGCTNVDRELCILCGANEEYYVEEMFAYEQKIPGYREMGFGARAVREDGTGERLLLVSVGLRY